MAKKVTAKSTKAEILEAFAELQREKTSLESTIKKINKSNSTSSISTVTKSVSEPKTMPSSITLQADINQTIQNLEKLQVSFGGAVSKLSEKLITEASDLIELQQSVTEEVERLKELHNLEEITDETLADLIQSYQTSSKQLTEEYSQQQEELEQQIQELNKNWQKEQTNQLRELKERNENHKKEQQRDEQEYQYGLKLERELLEEEHQQNKKELYKELEEVKEGQEKQWDEKEKSIAAQEKDYAEAKEKVEAFEKELEAKIKQGKEEGKAIGHYQAKVKADLRAKEVEGEKNNYQLRIQSLEETIGTNQARINSLSKQLDAALKQVQDLAVKAIEGTSNRSSFEAMKEIALEQAKNQQKGK